jgi:hypothetical protein
VELARQHGVYAVAHPLRLDYTRLKAAARIFRPAPKDNQSAFVELIAPKPMKLHEFVIEIEAYTAPRCASSGERPHRGWAITRKIVLKIVFLSRTITERNVARRLGPKPVTRVLMVLSETF